MRFLYPNTLLWLFAVVGLTVAWSVLEKRAKRKFSQFASDLVLANLVPGYSPVRRRWKGALILIAISLGIVALARPQMGTHEETLRSEGLDLVFLLDVSNSMLAEDIVPNRLKKSKHIIRNFLDRLGGDRAGVVAFAGSAFPAIPLTTDYEFVRTALESVDEKSIQNQGTDLSKALSVALDLLDRGGLNEEHGGDNESDAANDASRVLIILSDGEDVSGNEKAEKAEKEIIERIRRKGVRVYSIGVGSLKGAPIPIRDDHGNSRGFKRDGSGTMVHSKLSPASLEKVAKESSGKFFSASINEGEVEEIINELKSLERGQGAERTIIVYDEFYQYPLFLALFCGLFSLLLREKAVSVLLLILFFVSARTLMADSSTAPPTGSLFEYRNTEKGVESYEEGRFSDAIQFFGSAQAENPESWIHNLNLGDAFLRSGAPDLAAPFFTEVMKSKNPDEAAMGAFNLGKAFEAAKNFEQAIRTYQDGLDRKPSQEIRDRLKGALEKAEQQKQQQQQQNQDDQQKKDQQNDNKKDPKDSDKDQKNQQNPQKDKQVKAPPRQKPKFQPEKLSEDDAKKVLGQLKEQEKKTQKRLMQKQGEANRGDAKTGKDW